MKFPPPITKPPKPAPAPIRFSIDDAIRVSEGRPEWMALERLIQRRLAGAMWAEMAAIGLIDPDYEPVELDDDQIVPDNTDPLPPEPEIKTDEVPVDDE
jgi:hypothetical protein